MGGPQSSGGDPSAEPAADEWNVLDSTTAGRTAIRGGLLRTAAYVVGLMMALVSAPLLVRHLGTDDFGRYSTVLAIIAIVAGLSEGGVNAVALRELATARNRADRGEVMAQLLGLRLALSLVGVGIAVAFALVAGYDDMLVLGTFVAGIGMLIALSQTLLSSVLQARLRFVAASLVDLSRQAATTLIVIGLVVLGAGLLPFWAAAIPAGALSLVLTIAFIRREITLRPAFHPRRWVSLLRDTFVFALAIAVNSLYFRVTLVLLSLIGTATETGDFAVSFRVMEVLVGVPALLVGAAFPIISRSVRADRERFDISAARLFELALFVGTLAALCLTLLAPIVIEILTGSPRQEPVDVLRIQSVALIAGFIASATGFPLLSMHRNWETLLANGASLVVAVAMTFLLVPVLGAQGAALSAVLGDFTLATTNTAMLIRAGGPRLPLTAVPAAALAGGLGYGAGLAIGSFPILQTIVAAGVFLATLALIGRFPPEVREVLSRRRPVRQDP